MNKLFTGMGGKFKFSAQDRDLEYLFWRSKNLPVPSDITPPLCRAVARSENLGGGRHVVTWWAYFAPLHLQQPLAM